MSQFAGSYGSSNIIKNTLFSPTKHVLLHVNVLHLNTIIISTYIMIIGLLQIKTYIHKYLCTVDLDPSFLGTESIPRITRSCVTLVTYKTQDNDPIL